MKVKYKLSDKKVRELFEAGSDYNSERDVEFELSDLTPEARKAWAEMWGTEENCVRLCEWVIGGGQIYDDGNVDSEKPELKQWGNDIVQQNILQKGDVSSAIVQLYQQYLARKTELEQYVPKWREALQQYSARKAAERAKEEAEERAEAKRKERLMSVAWAKAASKKLQIAKKREAEIQRFCAKFGFAREDVITEVINNKPFVRCKATAYMNINDEERELEVVNRVYENCEHDCEPNPPEFDDLDYEIAQAVAEVLRGEVKTVIRSDCAHLDVVVGQDTIKIATVGLSW